MGPLVGDIRAEAARLGIEIVPVIIDDGSTDRTAQMAAAAGARVVQLPKNLGIGGAVQTGLRLAWREGFSCAVQIDGDGQHPPEEIGKLLAALDATPTPDLIVGTRYGEDRQGFQSTILRRLGTYSSEHEPISVGRCDPSQNRIEDRPRNGGRTFPQ